MAALAIEAVLSALDPDNSHRLRLPPAGLPSTAQVLSVLCGLILLASTPRLWRGTRTALSLAIAGLCGLALLNVAAGHRVGEAVVELTLAGLLALGRRSFRLGCRNRPRPTMVCAAAAAWGVSFLVLRATPLLSHPAGRLNGDWRSLAEVLIAFAVLTSVVALRSLLRPRVARNGYTEREYRAARGAIEQYGEDSLSPFLLRPDKALHFAAGGVLSYTVIGETAIVSSDPVAPDHRAPQVLESFRELARRHGWEVVVWAASARHLAAYRALGLKSICVGEEAVVEPAAFSLEGRPVRKLRQSVHRMRRRGWKVSAVDGRRVDAELEQELDRLEHSWRASQPRLIGFAMGMGRFDCDLRPDDLVVLGRAPGGELRAAMRFAAHRGRLSLDTMRRVGDTPNGLNEALVCRALEVARDRGVPEVSLNYAGLAHLLREPAAGSRPAVAVTRAAVPLLASRFQMERLVRFNDKFSPRWRRRYLVYESRGALPRSIVRVLQAEGYLPWRPQPGAGRRGLALPRIRPRSAPVKGTG